MHMKTALGGRWCDDIGVCGRRPEGVEMQLLMYGGQRAGENEARLLIG